MEIRFLKPEDAEQLCDFVAAHPHGSIEQSWAWGQLQCTIPGRTAFYVFGVFEAGADHGEKLVASMLVIRQQMGFGKTWLWSPRGPLLALGREEKSWEILRSEIEKIARREGDLYLRVEPGMPAGHMELGGKPSRESYMPEHTLMVDLTSSEEEILKQMAQKGRYNIKQAEKKGVFVVKSKLTDFDAFYEMLKETAVRDGFHVHEKEFYENVLEILDGAAHFYLAYTDHTLLAGLIVTHFGGTATYYYGASSNAHRDFYAPYALQWFAMREAKNAGMKRYDFLGIAPEGQLKHPLSGVTQFKTRFGGEKVAYAKAERFVYRPFWSALIGFAKRLKRN